MTIAARESTDHALIWSSLCLLLMLYFFSHILEVFHGNFPVLAIVALNVLSSSCFALLHGALRYSLRGIAAFFVIFLVISGIFENIGVLTGFPFGDYFFTSVMGPKLFVVPIFLSIAYLGMAYVSWTLACIILREPRHPASVILVPLLAAFLMVAWDFAMDPIWANLVHTWTWRRGGAYFGVPISNFFGWFLTNFLCYLAFAIYARRRLPASNPLPLSLSRLPILFYVLCALGNAFLYFGAPANLIVVDPSGAAWNSRSITAACALVSIFLMLPFALLAFLRLADSR
jgi:uncharacterized membrane protein